MPLHWDKRFGTDCAIAAFLLGRLQCGVGSRDGLIGTLVDPAIGNADADRECRAVECDLAGFDSWLTKIRPACHFILLGHARCESAGVGRPVRGRRSGFRPSGPGAVRNASRIPIQSGRTLCRQDWRLSERSSVSAQCIGQSATHAGPTLPRGLPLCPESGPQRRDARRGHVRSESLK